MRRFKQTILKSLVVGALAISLVVTPLLAPLAANAQLSTVVAASVPDTTMQTLNKIYSTIKDVAMDALFRVVSYAMRKVAYDSAVYLASGGKGQGALAETKSFGDYLGNVADEAVGKGIEELGKPYGFNLCKIPDIKVDLALRIGLRNNLLNLNPNTGYNNQDKPNCTLTQFKDNWLTADSWKSRYGDKQGFLKTFNTSLTFDDSELGVALDSKAKLEGLQANALAGASLQRQEGQGAKPDVDPISGNFKKPAFLNKQDFEKTAPVNQQEKDERLLSTAIQSGSGVQIVGGVLSIFLNSLVSNMVKNYQEKGIFPFGAGCSDGTDNCFGGSNPASSYDLVGIVGGRRNAENLFSEMLVVKINDVEDYDLLGQLGSCGTKGIYNCRADADLIGAVKQADSGKALTIQEALDAKLLHGDRPIIPPALESSYRDRCNKDAYCYSNLKVLRQARILPLGFEIAALHSSADHPWSLADVVAGFNNCPPNGNGQYDSHYPFCHLIDPNWVLKAPLTRCAALAPGQQQLSSGVPDRLEDCSDLTSCVAYGSDGKCIDYAYCTREKNAWNFGNAKQCKPAYASCRAFNSNGTQVAYLGRTLDTSFCNADLTGCAAYSLTQNNGQWVQPGIKLADNTNNGVFLRNVSSCSASAAGCSAFTTNVGGASQTVTLRKAPDYLGCYGSANRWPQTQADLNLINSSAECNQYAGVCIADEVGCQWYTSLGSTIEDSVPGKVKFADGVSWNDECDKKCVGYAAYREVPSNFSGGQDVAYIIPSSTQTCAEVDVGCTAFTNLSANAGGGEQVEYYSKLEMCELPKNNPGKTYVSYERTASGGYQLKTYLLVPNTDASNGPVGAPKYFFKNLNELTDLLGNCNKAVYDAGGDSFCQQFNDASGTVYYRFVDHVIPVSESCTPYRLNNNEMYVDTSIPNQAACTNEPISGHWNNGACEICYQNGKYVNGTCQYMALPDGVKNNAGTSSACSAAADTCRAYKGTAGNNVRNIFSDTFNVTSSLAIWSGQGVISRTTESFRANGFSLAYNGGGSFSRSIVEKITPGLAYSATFWVKGNVGSVRVRLASANRQWTADLGSVGVGDTWQRVSVGPVTYGGASSDALIEFVVEKNGVVYLDNIRLIGSQGNQYLVKKNLSVDQACDDNLQDNLPGHALGCTAYSNANKQPVYLTNFSYLCRPGAIGCTAFSDTRNTLDTTGPKAYNVWFAGLPGQKIKRGDQECTVPLDQAGCYLNLSGVSATDLQSSPYNGTFDKSTIYIPEDSSSSSLIYLVYNENTKCAAADVGCTNAGLQRYSAQGATFITTTIKNDPASYQSSLCVAQSVGCNAYSDGSITRYFKDPLQTGQRVCTYLAGVEVQGVKRSGWFWKGVGVCKNGGANCTKDADCGGAVGSCANINQQPCYPNYFKDGEFGLWSYGNTTTYQNFVGECPTDQNKCTEFVDHNDIDSTGKPASHYLIKNESLDVKSCDGSVSQKQGCVALEDTSEIRKDFSTQALYQQSNAQNGALVRALASTNPLLPNDANTIVKVSRTRECGEWLQCRSSHRVWDAKKGSWKDVCDDLGRCDKASPTGSDGNANTCVHWIDGDVNDVLSDKLLTESRYINRAVNWAGLEYSGFSILNMYPVEQLRQINISTSTDWRLVKPVACGGVNCKGSPNDSVCRTEGQPCGRDIVGICYNQTCMQTPSGDTANLGPQAPKPICRAYPESSSPFPNTTQISPALKGTAQDFSSVNFCQEVTAASSNPDQAYACECDYTKVNYGQSITRYWSFNDPNGLEPTKNPYGNDVKDPEGICQGGSQEGKACNSDNDCFRVDENGATAKDNGNNIINGSCVKKTRETSWLGWHGYCLETDNSRTINGDPNKHPCTTWYPVDSVLGFADVNGQRDTAGYKTPALGGRYYCLNSNGLGGAKTDYTLKGVSILMDTSGGQQDQFKEETFVPPGLETTLYQEDIEKITFEVVARDDEDPKIGGRFDVWPNEKPDNGRPQAQYDVHPDKQDPGFVVTGNYMGKNNEFIILYGSKADGGVQYVNKNGDITYGTINNGAATGDKLHGNVFAAHGSLVDWIYTLDNDGLWDRRVVEAARTEPDDKHLPLCPSNPFGTNFGSGNWHAIRIKFSQTDHKFVGYDTAYCDQSGGSGHIFYNITFTLRENCNYVADSFTDYLPNNTVPWANRLWQRGARSYVITNASNPSTALGYDYLTAFSPVFGSLRTNQNFADPVASPVQLTQWDKPPAVCPANNLPLVGDVTGCAFNVKGGLSVEGAPYSCNNGQNNPNCIRNTNGDTVPTDAASYDVNGGTKNLGQIFARVKNIFQYGYSVSGDGRYQNIAIPNGFYNYTYAGDGIYKPTGPLIYPPGTCYTLGQSGDQCLEDQTNGTGFALNGKASGDVVIKSGDKVSARFYAIAQSDQLPLRRLMVNWGDGNITDRGLGEYPNARGLRGGNTCDNYGLCVGNAAVAGKRCQQNTDCGIEHFQCVPWGVCQDNNNIQCMVNSDCPPNKACMQKNNNSCDMGTNNGKHNKGNACKADSDCPFKANGATCSNSQLNCRYSAKSCSVKGDTCDPVEQCVPENVATDWGYVLGKSCDNSYYQFDHTYYCHKSEAKPSAICNQYGLPDGCCVFGVDDPSKKPYVKVLDNWGWCNGSCEGPDKGCYDNNDGVHGFDKCANDPQYRFGTRFNGRVIVAPQ